MIDANDDAKRPRYGFSVRLINCNASSTYLL
jgi:hypothetical protein